MLLSLLCQLPLSTCKHFGLFLHAGFFSPWATAFLSVGVPSIRGELDGDPCTTAARAARRSAFDADILQSVESRHTDFVMTGNLVVFRKISFLCFKQINRQSLASLLEGQLVLLTLLRFDHLVAMLGCWTRAATVSGHPVDPIEIETFLVSQPSDAWAMTVRSLKVKAACHAMTTTKIRSALHKQDQDPQSSQGLRAHDKNQSQCCTKCVYCLLQSKLQCTGCNIISLKDSLLCPCGFLARSQLNQSNGCWSNMR